MTDLSVEQIRPQELMERKLRHLQADEEFLRSRRDQFVRVPCVACGGSALEPAWEKIGFSYERCSDCGTVMTNPRPTEAILAEFYATSENYAFWNEHIFPASEDARRERIFKPRVDRMLELCDRSGVGRGALLEVGAGFGTFCQEVAARRAFERVMAVEPSADLAATIRGRDIEVVEAPFEQHALERASVDVVAAFEVIEHVFSPASFAAACAQVLRPGGLAIVSCPNIKGFDTLVLGRDADAVDHEHLNYFNPRSLALLFERHGFVVEEVLTPGRLDVDLVLGALGDGRVDPALRPLLEHLLIERGDELASRLQDFLADNGLSSHLWIVARAQHAG
jgi:2-polyprenyl-3-methyl-5-hydroxy-6-metoxy-1,4-benzoquinol methylase